MNHQMKGTLPLHLDQMPAPRLAVGDVDPFVHVTIGDQEKMTIQP